jgi:hypothetical protein
MDDDERERRTGQNVWLGAQQEKLAGEMGFVVGSIFGILAGIGMYRYVSSNPIVITVAVLPAFVVGAIMGYRFYPIFVILFLIAIIFAVVAFIVWLI